MGLTGKVIKAGMWLSIYRVGTKFAGLIKTAIVARILTPTQFGIFGLVSIALNLLETFTETGLEQALIHKPKVTSEDLSTAWLIVNLRSLVVSLILLISAPIFAHFFNQPSVTIFIQVIAITPILRGLRNPNMVFLKKKLEFGKETAMLISGAVAEVFVGIIAVVLLRNVWGLILSIMAGSIVELVVSYLVISPPKLSKPNLSAGLPLIKFGKWVWASSALSYIVNQGDDIVVGKLLGIDSLGFYQNAYKIASAPATQVTGTITQITFPAFSQIQADKKRLLRAFKRSLGFAALITLPLSLLIFTFPAQIISLALGDQWLMAAPALKILAIYGLIRSTSSLMAPLANALGRPDLITFTGLIRAAVLFATIYPLSVALGIAGTAWATVIAITVANTILAFRLYRLLK